MHKNIFDIDLKLKMYYAEARCEMIAFVPEGAARALDIGCGEGEFGRGLKQQRNIEVWGVEICRAAADRAQAKLDKVVVGDIENADLLLPCNYFDCIIFNDILEHLMYPWIVLKKIRNHLQRDGYIIASIPNVRYFDNIKKLIAHKEWEYEDEGILDKTHLRFFTEKSIKRMFEICGYQVLKMLGIRGVKFPWKFRLFNYILVRAFEDMRYPRFAVVARKV